MRHKPHSTRTDAPTCTVCNRTLYREQLGMSGTPTVAAYRDELSESLLCPGDEAQETINAAAARVDALMDAQHDADGRYVYVDDTPAVLEARAELSTAFITYAEWEWSEQEWATWSAGRERQTMADARPNDMIEFEWDTCTVEDACQVLVRVVLGPDEDGQPESPTIAIRGVWMDDNGIVLHAGWAQVCRDAWMGPTC